AEGKLVGVDPSDTVARYIDAQGRVKIAVSNKVCFCVPRYLLVRTAITTASNVSRVNTGDTRVAHAPGQAQQLVATNENHLGTALGGLTTRIKTSSLVNLQMVQIIGRMEGLAIYSNAVGTGHITGKCLEAIPAELVGKPLV